MRQFFLCILSVALVSCGNSQSNTPWQQTAESFIKSYNSLGFQPLQLSYIQNLQNIQSLDTLLKQEDLFVNLQHQLRSVETTNFSIEDWIDYELLNYEAALNLKRLELEKRWWANRPDTISAAGLSSVPNGPEWYAYFLAKWVDLDATPESMYEFGLSEVARVENEMEALKERSGLSREAFQEKIDGPEFIYTSQEKVQAAFEARRDKVAESLPSYFPFLDQIPEVNIALGTNARMARAPAYYMEPELTFYYNIANNEYNRRQIGWVYTHEALPGHHYQTSLDRELPRTDIQRLFQYFGYIEGWGAYVEEIGNEIGAYEDLYDELGKWEWDIIRSVRVVLDVGLNYYGWSDEQALEYWQEHIQNQDDIAAREIARMKRWPAQVITYKYGVGQFLALKNKAQASADFDWIEFHRSVLEHGSLPFSVLKKILNRKADS